MHMLLVTGHMALNILNILISAQCLNSVTCFICYFANVDLEEILVKDITRYSYQISIFLSYLILFRVLPLSLFLLI